MWGLHDNTKYKLSYAYAAVRRRFIIQIAIAVTACCPLNSHLHSCELKKQPAKKREQQFGKQMHARRSVDALAIKEHGNR